MMSYVVGQSEESNNMGCTAVKEVLGTKNTNGDKKKAMACKRMGFYSKSVHSVSAAEVSTVEDAKTTMLTAVFLVYIANKDDEL